MTSSPGSTANGDDQGHEVWRAEDIADISGVKLAGILRHLNRNTKAGRDRAAEDGATRSYLQAGLRLLVRAVSAEHDPEDRDPASHPFLSWLSRRAVVDEVSNETAPELPRRGTVSGMRDRWEPHRDYISDLILVALIADRSLAKAAGEFLRQNPEVSPVDAVHEVAYQDLIAVTDSEGFRVQMLAAALAGREPLAADSLTQMYTGVASSWIDVYDSIRHSWGLNFREGFDTTMLAELLLAMSEGLSLRLMAASETGIIDHERRRSLLGVGALALIAAVVDTDGVGFEQHIADVLGSGSRGDAS